MVRPSRLKVILLLIAMAQLATEVTRLVEAWTPSHIPHNITEEQMGSGQHDAYGSESDAARTDPGTKRANRQEPPGARGPPPDSRGYWPASSPSLRPDFRTSDPPPWCETCRQSERRCERRDYGWYCRWYAVW
jgi:hypothetical protein